MISVVDIDGTLSDFTHRVHLIDKVSPTMEDFRKFLSPDLMLQDPPYPKSLRGLAQLIVTSRYICFITGRNECLRRVNHKWIQMHYPFIHGAHIHMRPDGELSVATDYKKRMVEQRVLPYLDHENNESLLLIDDDPYVLAAYSQYGLALRAPACWDLLVHKQLPSQEPLFTR